MAKASTNDQGYVSTAAASGASDHIELSESSQWRLTFVSTGNFSVDLQVLAGDNATWLDEYSGGSKVNITHSGNKSFIVPSGTYRMNVASNAGVVTMYGRVSS